MTSWNLNISNSKLWHLSKADKNFCLVSVCFREVPLYSYVISMSLVCTRIVCGFDMNQFAEFVAKAAKLREVGSLGSGTQLIQLSWVC